MLIISVSRQKTPHTPLACRVLSSKGIRYPRAYKETNLTICYWFNGAQPNEHSAIVVLVLNGEGALRGLGTATPEQQPRGPGPLADEVHELFARASVSQSQRSQTVPAGLFGRPGLGLLRRRLAVLLLEPLQELPRECPRPQSCLSGAPCVALPLPQPKTLFPRGGSPIWLRECPFVHAAPFDVVVCG